MKLALDNVAEYVDYVLRKNKSLADFYIYPRRLPSEVAAYEPKIKVLEKRLKALKSLRLAHLKQLIDGAESLVAAHLLKIIDQLKSAIFGYQRLFEDHYDPSLSQRGVYGDVWQRLSIREHQLHDLINSSLSRRRQHRAQDEDRHGPLQFCDGAVQLLNDADKGNVSRVDDRDLLPSNRDVLRQYGGDYLWWRCSSCAFKLRFHVDRSQFSSITSNDEIREHVNVPLEYRSIFLAKSHLYQPVFEPGANSLKYGCLFCFAKGEELEGGGENCFGTGRELAVHICSKHKSTLPAPLLLDRFHVAVDEKLSPVARSQRWEVNIHTG